MDNSESFSKKWKDGEINFSITVEKVEGGYIITKEKYGNDSNGKNVSETKKSVSTVNPFENKNIGWTNEADDFKLKGITDPIIG